MKKLMKEMHDLYVSEANANQAKFKEPKSEYATMLEEALGTGDIAARSALYQKFRRSVKDCVEWHSCLSHKQKLDFRRRWLKQEWKHESSKRIRSSAVTEEHRQKGEFLSLDAIVVAEGGPRIMRMLKQPSGTP